MGNQNVTEEKEKKEKKRIVIRFGIIGWILLPILLAFIGVSGYHVFTSIREYSESYATRDEIIEEYVIVNQTDHSGTNPHTAQSPDLTPDPNNQIPNIPGNINEPEVLEYPPLSVDFKSLIEFNGDVIGWIYVPGTNISYPVVQGTDNYYYVYHNIKKQSSSSGTIMLDYRNSADFTDRNNIIYGHLMNSDTMFGELSQMTKSQEFIDEHLVAYLLTPTKNYRLDFVLITIVHAADDPYYTIFGTKSQLTDYLTHGGNGALYYNEENLDSVENIVTLSTCNKSFGGARLIVVSRMTEIWHE